MFQKAESRPKAAFCRPRIASSYFIAAEAALAAMLNELIAAEAAVPADDAASIADVAADEAAVLAEAAMSVTEAAADAIVAGGVTIVVVASSFFVQAAKVTAAASVAINRAVLMFLLDLGSYK